MKTYTITVNGNVYDVVVEEGAGAPAAAPVAAPKAAPKAPAAAPKAAAPAPAAAPKAAGAAGSIKVEAGAAGKVFKIDTVVGQAVIPVVAPQDGTFASINVAVGDAIEAGSLLATLN